MTSAKSTNFEVNFHWFCIKFGFILKTKCLSTHFLYFYHWVYWFSSYILDSNISIALLRHLITLDYWFISQYISLVVILFFYWCTVDHWLDCYWINFRWFGRNTFIFWNICFAIVEVRSAYYVKRHLIVSVETTLSVRIFLYFHILWFSLLDLYVCSIYLYLDVIRVSFCGVFRV